MRVHADYQDDFNVSTNVCMYFMEGEGLMLYQRLEPWWLAPEAIQGATGSIRRIETESRSWPIDK